QLERKRDDGPDPLRSAAAAGLSRLGRVAADPALDERLRSFIARASAFAQLMDLPGADPEIALVETPTPGAYAVWDPERHRYENPANLEERRLPPYVALMGPAHGQACSTAASAPAGVPTRGPGSSGTSFAPPLWAI